MSLTNADDYRRLIEQFLERRITVSQFERSFLERFKSERGRFSDHVFLVLDRLFSDVDMLCIDDDIRDGDDLDEEQLRDSCRKTLQTLANVPN